MVQQQLLKQQPPHLDDFGLDSIGFLRALPHAAVFPMENPDISL